MDSQKKKKSTSIYINKSNEFWYFLYLSLSNPEFGYPHGQASDLAIRIRGRNIQVKTLEGSKASKHYWK